MKQLVYVGLANILSTQNAKCKHGHGDMGNILLYSVSVLFLCLFVCLFIHQVYSVHILVEILGFGHVSFVT